MSERGSIAILIATYLSIILLAVIGFGSVGIAMLAGHRIQGVTDYAVLYGHDRAVRAGKPSAGRLKVEIRNFLESAVSAERLQIVSADSWVAGENSHLRLCARHRDPFGLRVSSMIVCREAAAKSFLVL
ncbi:MAG: hypothetical protein ACOVMF_00320 [Aquiluna sp.]|jgi:hypothetical protein